MADLSLRIGLDVIRSYKRLAYTPWYALAEFIDNSTQSYRDHQKALDRAYAAEGLPKRLRVSITYDRSSDVLVIRDTAMGMSATDLANALHIGKPPEDTTGRSQFGLGLKTAACWFGDKWTVRTKKLGESSGTEIVVDVDRVAQGESHRLPTTTFDAAASKHFTEIKIEKLHMKLHNRRLGKIKDSLTSMYRVDLRAKTLEIVWDTSPLPWQDEWTFLKGKRGAPAKVEFSFDVPTGPEDKRKRPTRKVKGWVGALAPGSSSRSNAGFALIRRGRLIRGWPEGWRPEDIFGPSPGRNDLINQRITGEIHLDDFDVTHTKDDILWQADEEDLVQSGIKDHSADILKIAREYRHPTPIAPQGQTLSLESVLDDAGFEASLNAKSRSVSSLIAAILPTKIADAAADSIVATLQRARVAMEIDLGRQKAKVIPVARLGAEGPYLVAHHAATHWSMVMNGLHPVCVGIEDTEALKVHVEHMIADGLVMWALYEGKIAPVPSTLLMFKDALLRSMLSS